MQLDRVDNYNIVNKAAQIDVTKFKKLIEAY